MQPPLTLESRAQTLCDDLLHFRAEAFSAQLAENVAYSYKFGLISLTGKIEQSTKGNTKGKLRVLSRLAIDICHIAESVIVNKMNSHPLESPKNSAMIEFITRETLAKRSTNRFYEYSGHCIITFSDEAAEPVKVTRIELEYTGEEFEKLFPIENC